MKVSDVIIHCLENEGVKYVFGIIGKETLDLADSLSKSNHIQFVNVRHEQGAAFMADVYGRLSKEVGICLSTLGPGATNLLTGIANAQLEHSPLIALIGQARMNRQHPESHQYLDIVKIFEPATKWSTQIIDAQTVSSNIRKAFKLAKLEKPGSVAIVFPENLLSLGTDNNPLPVMPIPESVPDNEVMIAAHSLIQNSKKPFLLVGNGVIRQDAVNELQTFINVLQAPVAHSFMAKGILPKEHPSNYFTFGFSENDVVVPGIGEADLLLTTGFDFVESPPKNWNKMKVPVLHMDSLPANIDEYYPTKIECIGNIKKTLQFLNKLETSAKPWTPAGNLRDRIMNEYQINDEEKDRSFTIEHVLHCIEQSIPRDTIVISDVGAHKVAIARTFQPKNPGRLIISNGLASMGFAIPGAIGAKLACPDEPVICITGDGGALMNFAEIETARRLGLPFIIIVINDSMLKLEVQQMIKRYGESYGATFQNPDFALLAESFGIKGIKAHNLDEFENILKVALQTLKEVILIEVVMQN
ncbi:acetolactate synthase large subunit [Robertmurraya andreesenii]|uniref:Acetolactate synthase-1/2/3 large subunit n=1 Tax=Anoxybacillus andreesenii TaxID=1325932 RepID=A0ABT9V9D6_9BACL|nr:acetolactate synthase large subunit [Robertmurraya andreesenii]MDQ0157535.1 acetolactate synthase-1/2/3 large subunit [Robertmurraya andreesenii]